MLLLLFPTVPAQAMEPLEIDFLPWLVDISFSDSDVGFVSQPHHMLNNHQFLLKLDRRSRHGHEVNVTTYTNTFKRSLTALEELGRGQNRNAIFTSQGTEYRVDDGYCNFDRWELASFKLASLYHAGQPVAVRLQPCRTVSAIEDVNDQLWIGTMLVGQHRVGTGQGVVVWSKNSKRVLRNISGLEGAITQVRWDPIGRSIWVTTTERIYQIGTDMKVKAELFMYHGFDSGSGMPILRIAPMEAKTNPLSVIARMFVVSDKKSFYEVAKDVPATSVCEVSLPYFFMCCSGGFKFYSPDINGLAPFFLTEARHATGHWQAIWLQAACQFDDPRVYEYVSSSSAAFSDRAQTVAAECQKKFETTRDH